MPGNVIEVENNNITVIKPKGGWQIFDLQALGEYRDLFYFLVWRDIKVMYAQTILGFAWALLQPLIQIVIFTVVFGKVARVNTDNIPYILFSTVAGGLRALELHLVCLQPDFELHSQRRSTRSH